MSILILFSRLIIYRMFSINFTNLYYINNVLNSIYGQYKKSVIDFHSYFVIN